MLIDVLMPQLGLEVSEGTVTAIFCEVGAAVEEGAALLELETDKASADVKAPRAGAVHSIEVAVGEVVAVGAVLMRLQDALDQAKAPSEVGEPPTPKVHDRPPRLRAAPIARRLAADLGVDLGEVPGSGPRGRITVEDVRRFAQARELAGSTVALEATPTEMSGLRSAIAQRMSVSQTIPQYQLQRDIDATNLLSEASGERSKSVGVGFNDLLIQALGEMLLRHPEIATAFLEPEGEGRPRQLPRRQANVGLAVATDRGLLVPVIKRVDELGLPAIARERRRLVAAARDGSIDLSEMSGGVVTLSNLGGFGVDRFVAMLNPGQSAILAVGRTVERVVPRGRALLVLPITTLTMTFDHRVIDGAVGAAALGELATLLEGAMRWRV